MPAFTLSADEKMADAMTRAMLGDAFADQALGNMIRAHNAVQQGTNANAWHQAQLRLSPAANKAACEEAIRLGRLYRAMMT